MPSISRIFFQRFFVHAVGQGFFYSGRISAGKNAFKFAFDCGSYSADAIMREIHTFETEIMQGSDVLDMLVISHFDEDHVNHISDLLRSVKKVKRLVMPFLDFEERLFLVMRIMERSRGRGARGPAGVDPALIRFILDPTGYLSDYLDGDSDVYLFSHEDGPVGPNRGNNGSVESDNENSFEEERPEQSRKNEADFEITPRSRLGRTALRLMRMSFTRAVMYEVRDISPGMMLIRDKKLMEFIFYKRPLDHDEVRFYQLVAAKFKKEFKIPDLKLDTVLEKVKLIKSATKIKKIFEEAAVECSLPVSEMRNLNNTALCMLHRNLPELAKKIFGAKHEIAMEPYFHFLAKTIETRHHFSGHGMVYKTFSGYPAYWLRRYFLYPNTLLTSDVFIKKNSDRKKFLDKFSPYFNEVWLIQVPHHGSEKNIIKDFITSINYHEHVAFFINYGVKNGSGHPDESVIEWLQEVETDRRLHLVNEWQGLAFELKLES